MPRITPALLLLPALLLSCGCCKWTIKQTPPETFHENQSGFVDDEDGKGTHWETNEVNGVRGGWELKPEK
jgi:hypothetical protein